jgi:hypothetical protein
MATYDELATIANNSGGVLLTKIMVAGQMAAGAIVAESTGTANHAARVVWARSAFADPAAAARALIWPVLYLNKDFTKAQIEGAADTAVQTAVNTVVTALAV